MDRRKALKTIGYGSGAITLTPTIIGLFHSCQNNSSNFFPEYFNKNQFSIVSQLMELIPIQIKPSNLNGFQFFQKKRLKPIHIIFFQ